MSRLTPFALFLTLGGLVPRHAAPTETLLLRSPTVSATTVAFVYANDLWVAPRAGGEARRLTVHPGRETNPYFSPDGKWIAFTGEYDGNADVYVVSVDGGDPRRLTFHPGADVVEGWTPDGRAVLFASTRLSHSFYDRLFTVPVDGGFEEPLPQPMAERGAYSADAGRIAYNPIRNLWTEDTWRHYRGGQEPFVWIFDFKTQDIEVVPHDNTNDTWPMWIGDVVYFVSDRDGTMNLYGYDTKSKQVRQLTHHTDFDIKAASAGAGVIVYEQGGGLHLFDPASATTTPISIHIDPDLPDTRPRFTSAVPFIQHVGISPTGMRALFEARGDIFTVPAKKGDIRDLTRTPGIAERDPAWSPDGKTIAYFSDAGGEYRLMLRDQSGMGDETAIALDGPSFYYTPTWSPDGKRIAYSDKRLKLWIVDLATKRPVVVDSDTYEHPERSLSTPVWSPDSKWLAYAKRQSNQLRAIMLYDVAAGAPHQVTDGRSDAIAPAFSLDGKYLYFAASTNFALNVGWIDLSSSERPVRRSLYVAVLDRNAPSPLAPESDEEPATPPPVPAKDTSKKADSVPVTRVDLTGIDQRILALSVPERDYSGLSAAAEGRLFYLENVPNQPGFVLHRYDPKERKAEDFLTGITDYAVSHDGKKLLYRAPGDAFGIVPTDGKASIGDGKLDLAAMQIYVEPRAEWQQMFEEFWRVERDFFYDPGMHGANWKAIHDRYRPWLDYVGHREDLNYLIAQMMGEMVVGHNFVGGGDMPRIDTVAVGLLGADYQIENGVYRFRRVYRGLNWNPNLRAPLTEPGVNVNAGDYLLAVNGRPLRAPTNVYALFANTVGRQTTLTVNSKPVPQGARTVTVVPVANETGLRHRAWIEGNVHLVDSLSSGRVAYVHMPNTAGGGFTEFNRYYFSQLDRSATILDERFNTGGDIADYVEDMLNRPVLAYMATRNGRVFSSPAASIYGPKVMVTNEYAGSGGDAMPLYFRRRGLGKLVGKRTWGGLVGIYDYPTLMDGGFITAPRIALFSPIGEWDAENVGVPPDVEVEMTPKLVIGGHDPQLERAVAVVLEELAKNPPPAHAVPHPAYPTRAKTP
ncbi:MAG TPA: PDZ domain-containing protein [Gemmatimonadales bacterium]|nr:PDZ domain-containing protein [Gemmatimonadales bacterium]